MYRFNRRTAEPLGPCSALGSDKPTSRCQTTPSIGTLKGYQPVIPGVPFIRWSMVFPYTNHRVTTANIQFLFSVSASQLGKFLLLRSTNNYFRFELTIAHPRYFLGGDRPSQTTNHTRFKFMKFIVKKNQQGGVSTTYSNNSHLSCAVDF